MAFFNIFDLVTVEERPEDPQVTWFAVDPAVMYPAMRIHILGAIVAGRTPPEHLKVHYQDAMAVTQQGWESMEMPRDQVDPDLVDARVAALECARRWFTAMLHVTIGGAPMGVHILKNEDWRL